MSQVFAPWGDDFDPGVITKLFKNGMVKIQWSDGTKASKVDGTEIDATRSVAAKKAAEEAAKEADKEAATMEEGGEQEAATMEEGGEQEVVALEAHQD